MYLHFFIFFCYQVLGVGGEEGCCTVKVFHVRCSAVNFVNEQYKVRPHAMDIHGVRFCYGSVVQPGAGNHNSSLSTVRLRGLGEKLSVLVI